MTRSAPAAKASRSSSRSSTSISTGIVAARLRTAANASATPPMEATWLSLTSAASLSDMRWLTPPPQRTAYFCRARRPGIVLRVSRTARTGCQLSASAQLRGERGDAAQMAQQVQRAAFGGQQLAGRRIDGHQRVATPDAGAVGDELVDRRRIAADGVDHRGGHRQTGDRAGGAGGEHGDAALVGRHRRGGGDVDASVEILGHRRPDQRGNGIGVEPGVEQSLPSAGRDRVRPGHRSTSDAQTRRGRRPGWPPTAGAPRSSRRTSRWVSHTSRGSVKSVRR